MLLVNELVQVLCFKNLWLLLLKSEEAISEINGFRSILLMNCVLKLTRMPSYGISKFNKLL